jgi:hypothetical protein
LRGAARVAEREAEAELEAGRETERAVLVRGVLL